MGVGALLGVFVGVIVGRISGVPVAGEQLWFGEASQLAPWLVVLTGYGPAAAEHRHQCLQNSSTGSISFA
jgi:hypothetical protein